MKFTYDDIPARIRAELSRYNETVAIKCKRRGCKEIIDVRFDYLSSSGIWDLDCPAGHCELYDSPKDRAILEPFYARMHILHNPKSQDEWEHEIGELHCT